MPIWLNAPDRWRGPPLGALPAGLREPRKQLAYVGQSPTFNAGTLMAAYGEYVALHGALPTTRQFLTHVGALQATYSVGERQMGQEKLHTG